MKYNGENHVVVGLHEDKHFRKDEPEEEEKPDRYMIEEVRQFVVDAFSADEAREEFDCMSDSLKDKVVRTTAIRYLEKI